MFQRCTNSKSVFQRFSNETSLHGFNRLWIGSFLRWPFWSLLLFVAIVMSFYQMHDKLKVLIENPLNVNINLAYKEELEFPSVTICNKLKVRVSFVVNNTEFLSILHLLFPETNINVTDQDLEAIKTIDQNWNSKKFFAQAAIPKEEVILWCRLPTGEKCSSDDFETIITDEGYCFRFAKKLILENTGRGTALRLLLNLAQYERLPDTEASSGLRIVIHEHDEPPMPNNGYDLMPGYQVAMVIRKSINTQLGNCESGNPLQYYAKYTYPACQVERNLIDTARKCRCKPYTLPNPVHLNKSRSIDRLPDCSLMKHYSCIEKSILDYSVHNKSNVDYKSHTSHCTGECVRREFEQELYYNTFRENYAYKTMLEDKVTFVQDAYQRGKDAAAYLKLFYNKDSDYMDVVGAAGGFKTLIVDKKLIPPYGSIFDTLTERMPCLNDIFDIYGTNITEMKMLLKSFNTTLTGAIIKSIIQLEPQIELLEIEKLLNFSISLKHVHLPTCSVVYPEICSLPALYDMLKIRAQLETKLEQVDLLRNGHFRNLSLLTTVYGREITQRPHTFKHIKHEDREHLNDILQYYVKQMNTCLTETSRVYDEILTSGQPTMKQEQLYDNFVQKLKLAHWVITETCKQAGPAVRVSFQVDSRRELALKIVKIIAHSETSTMKSVRFNNAMIEFVEDFRKKFADSSYDERKLNQSLNDIEAMDNLLNKYLNQTTKEVFLKSEFYNQLFLANLPFQLGIQQYKTIVDTYLRDMEMFIQVIVDKLIELYPGADSDLDKLKKEITLDDLKNSNSTINGTTDLLDQIICIKKSRIALTDMKLLTTKGDVELDTYKQYIDRLIYELKLYVDDARSLKGFYQENIGVLKIYFRDMGVKESRQERAYDFFSFLCDVGGIIGLWLGGSLISLFEIVDILCCANVSRWFGFKPQLTVSSSTKVRDTRDGSIAPSDIQIQENGLQTSTHSASNYHSCRESLSLNV